MRAQRPPDLGPGSGASRSIFTSIFASPRQHGATVTEGSPAVRLRAELCQGAGVRAVVVTEFGVAPVVQEVPDPQVPADGVVVAVEATGLCRSDWHGWLGHDPDVVLPHVPGHELAGTVLAVGPQVRRWAPGARVTVPFVCACGKCPTCLAGDGQVCPDQTQPGFTHWGSFADLVALHA